MSNLLTRLAPFACGAFSGRVSEWPQLKPLIREAYNEIKEVHINIDEAYAQMKRLEQRIEALDHENACLMAQLKTYGEAE